MNTFDPELANAAMQKEYDRWTNLLLQRGFWFQEQRQKIAEKQLQQIVFLSTISAGNLAIVLPLNFNQTNSIFITSFWIFFINLLLGIGIVILALNLDSKDFSKAKEEELSLYRKFQRSALKALNKTDQGSVKFYLDIIEESKSDLSKSIKPSLAPEILNGLYYSFIASFFLGLISIAFSFF